MNIKTLSPHYISVPLINPNTEEVCSSFTVKLYVWNGLKTAAPSEPAYIVTKLNAAASNGVDKINIARIVNDYIEFSCEPQSTTTLVDGNNQVWVKFEMYYDDEVEIPASETVYLAVKGYGLFLEGENPQAATPVLLSGDEFKVSRGGRFVFPLMALEPEVAPRSISINDAYLYSGYAYEYEVTANFPYTTLSAEFRAAGETEWGPLTTFNLQDPNRILVQANIADFPPFETRVSAFDFVTSERIYSAIFTITT